MRHLATISPRCGLALLALVALAAPAPALAQALDLGASPPGQPAPPIQITADNGIQLQQDNHVVIALGNATAVRGAVTIKADQLIAHYRPKPGSQPPAPVGGTNTTAGAATDAPAAPSDPLAALGAGSSEIYELEAVGHVHIFTTTDNAYADHAVYMADTSILTLTGGGLKLTTPTATLTARDALLYNAQAHIATANGNATVVSTADGRTVTADQLVAQLQPSSPAPGTQGGAAASPDQSSQLKRVDAIGNVVIHTATEVAMGDKGDYEPSTGPAAAGPGTSGASGQNGIAHLFGNVRLTRGPNEMTGGHATVDMKTGVATLFAAPGGQVAGQVVPNSAGGTESDTSKP